MAIDRRALLIGFGGAGGAIVAAQHWLDSPAQAAVPRANLYDCEGCEAALERPLASLTSRVQLAGPDEPGQRMILTGRVMTADGARPAPNVVVYAHHTNAAGLYAGGQRGTEWSMRHGKLRGWAKTGADGVYVFMTIKPAPYPSQTMPAHVHLYIAELGRRPYYIDDVVFAGEFGVTPAYRARQELRAGSGIVTLGRARNTMLLARRDFRLERHPT
ncbi:MAG: intradiol ring-cleavage dioxygenase [Pseudomonadota bacterium]